MRAALPCILLAVAIGCGGSAEDETTTAKDCVDASSLITELGKAAQVMDDFSRAQLSETSLACERIYLDLGGNDDWFGTMAAADHVREVCGEAAALIDVRLAAGATLSVSMSGGGCTSDDGVRDACLAACGEVVGCEPVCAIEGRLAGGCTLPSVDVVSSDAELEATLVSHLPRLALDTLDVWGDTMSDFATLTSSVTTQFISDAACAVENGDDLVGTLEQASLLSVSVSAAAEGSASVLAAAL